jgi:phosphoribosyl-AMP cyclohydrolase
MLNPENLSPILSDSQIRPGSIVSSTVNSSASAIIDFEKNGGVIPVVAVNHANGRVLMLAYMNREAFEETVATGRACYYSRSRKKLWRKGEESGNFQVVREIRLDCDEDTVLLSVEQRGDGAACHVGYESDFFRMLKDGEWLTVDTRLVDPAKYGPNYGHPVKPDVAKDAIKKPAS